MAQVDQAAQAPSPVAALKVSVAQALHTRSLETVGAKLRYSPAAQTAPTVSHAAPLTSSEYSVVPSHAPHCRSAVALPTVLWPSPAGQVDQAAHAALLSLAWKYPLAQAGHTRSLEAVAIAVEYVPAAHVAVTAPQASALLLALKSVPTVQAGHVRSAVALPSTYPVPAAQAVFQAAHASSPVPALKYPPAQALHTSSLEAVAPVLRYSPAGQALRTSLHALPSLTSEYVVTPLHAAHVRSAVVLPAASWPWPMAHVPQVPQEVWPAATTNWPEAQAGHDELAVLDWY